MQADPSKKKVRPMTASDRAATDGHEAAAPRWHSVTGKPWIRRLPRHFRLVYPG